MCHCKQWLLEERTFIVISLQTMVFVCNGISLIGHQCWYFRQFLISQWPRVLARIFCIRVRNKTIICRRGSNPLRILYFLTNNCVSVRGFFFKNGTHSRNILCPRLRPERPKQCLQKFTPIGQRNFGCNNQWKSSQHYPGPKDSLVQAKSRTEIK